MLFGKRPEDVLSRTVFELFPTLADGPSGAAIREAVELGHSAIIEVESAAMGGWIECRVYPTASGISLYLRDIDARHRRESERDQFLDALIASEERFRALFNSMTEGVALHEVVYRDGRPVDYRILDVNPAYERHTGLGKTEVTGSLASEAYGSGEAPYLAEYSHVAETGEALQFETYYEPLGRAYRITAVPVGTGRFATVFEDVSERRARDLEREELLRSAQRSEEGFAAVFEQSPFAVALSRMPAGTIVRVNRAFEQLFGYERDRLIGRTSPDLGISDPESQALVAELFRSQGAVRDFECVRRTASGEERVISLNLDSIALDDEEFVLTTVQDVSERTRAQAALRESEQRLRIAQGAAGLGLHDWDIRSGEIRWDDRIRDIWGVGPDEEISYETFIRGVHPDDRDRVQAVVDTALDPAGTRTYDVTYRVTVGEARAERWGARDRRSHLRERRGDPPHRHARGRDAAQAGRGGHPGGGREAPGRGRVGAAAARGHLSPLGVAHAGRGPRPAARRHSVAHRTAASLRVPCGRRAPRADDAGRPRHRPASGRSTFLL